MARKEILIGGKTITYRYIGNKLVWKRNVLRMVKSLSTALMYARNERMIRLSPAGLDNLEYTFIEFNGYRHPVKAKSYNSSYLSLELIESIADFEKKSGWNAYRSFYGNTAIKLYVGGN